MPEVTSPYVPGTPCWIDLMVPDQQQALDFYRELFGWEGEVGPEEFGGYSVCTLKGKPVAGIMKAMSMDPTQPPPPPTWTSYFSSADADRTQAEVAKNGGTVVAPAQDVGTLGRMVIALDPQGAPFGVWQPKDFQGATIVNEHGSLVWNQLNTSDPKAAAGFYKAAVGLDARGLDENPDFTGFFVKGRAVGGVQSLEHAPPGTPPHWLVNFAVKNADATVETLTKAGGKALVGPFDMEQVGRMAVVQDSQGAVFSVVALFGEVPPLP